MRETLPAVAEAPRSWSKLGFLLNFVATIQFVWFYLTRMECHIKLLPFEQGKERTPFQYRLLMMIPLRWAHQSPAINHAAAWLNAQTAFFPGGVRPEGLVQAAIDLAAVGIAGLVARRLYQLASRTGLLISYVYPLTLLMVFCTYSLLTMHAYRFIYDLPALAFFSLGLYLIYTQANAAWFACVFVVGSINRETTLLLLVFFVLAQCSRGTNFNWRRSCAARTLRTALPLLAFWILWHLWVGHVFRANASAFQPRVWLNLAILAVPFTWPQLLAAFAYVLPLVILHRAHIHDKVLRTWLWNLPVWFAFMLYYGVFMEIRIFGELIPFVACIALLIAEEKLLILIGRQQREELARDTWSGSHVRVTKAERTPVCSSWELKASASSKMTSAAFSLII